MSVFFCREHFLKNFLQSRSVEIPLYPSVLLLLLFVLCPQLNCWLFYFLFLFEKLIIILIVQNYRVQRDNNQTRVVSVFNSLNFKIFWLIQNNCTQLGSLTFPSPCHYAAPLQLNAECTTVLHNTRTCHFHLAGFVIQLVSVLPCFQPLVILSLYSGKHFSTPSWDRDYVAFAFCTCWISLDAITQVHLFSYIWYTIISSYGSIIFYSR